MLPTILDVFLLALTIMKTYQNAILLKGAFRSSLVCQMSLNSGLSFDSCFFEDVHIAPGWDIVSSP